MDKSLPEISSVVVTQGYEDTGVGLDRRVGKFVVLFDNDWGRIDPASTTLIEVCGPRNYHFDIRPHERFDVRSLNGYVDDQYYGRVWHMLSKWPLPMES